MILNLEIEENVEDIGYLKKGDGEGRYLWSYDGQKQQHRNIDGDETVYEQ